MTWNQEGHRSGIPPPPPPEGDPQTYWMLLSTAAELRKFLVEGCRGRSEMRMAIRVHFFHRHVRDTVVILEEGKLTHPRQPRCDIMVPWMDLNGRHTTTDQCTKGVERKWGRLSVEYMRESTERSLQAYSTPLESITSFKYLGRIMTASNENCQEVVGKLRKERKRW